MKKFFSIISLLIVFGFTQAQDWVPIHAEDPVQGKTSLVSSSIVHSRIKFNVDGYFSAKVQTPQGEAQLIRLDGSTPILLKGAPDLPKMTTSVIIPDQAGMEANIVSSSYKEFKNIEVAPSRGNLTRDINPEDVPYVYGKQYQEDRFYPEKLADLRSPYIIRDYRGQTVIVYPFQYNPVKKILRVYDEITVELQQVNNDGFNPLVRKNEAEKIDMEFSKIYQKHFLNTTAQRYDPLEEHGNMLIISHGDFIDAIDSLAEWRIKTGTPTEVIDIASIGNNSNDIKTYIADYYNNNGLTFVLLVGDAAQITPSWSSGDSDIDYSYVVGNDHYPDLFVGRFSAETVAQVETQVSRTLDYEKNPNTDTDWFSANIGIASSQGPGDDNEYDYEHIRNIQSDLIAFTYTESAELFDGSQGGLDDPGNPTPQMVANEINAGSSLINYTGHGSTFSWGSSGFSNNDVDNLTNNGMLPFIWSVACVNGNFVGNTCFAEAWLRAENNGEPSGAIATMMSTINQSWNPPMSGQDEMNDILVESYTDNIKRTFGGISMNGCMQMNDDYGSAGDEMTDTWTCFGDPSLMVRTAMPADMLVSYNSTVFIGATQFFVTCDAEGAKVALTKEDVILATAFVENGSATLQFDALTEVGMLDLVITGFNYLPHIGQVEVIPANGPYVVYQSHEINDENGNGVLDYGESSYLSISLENIGTENATDVTAILSTEDDFVTIVDDTEFYGNIPSDSTKSIGDGFQIELANDIPDNHTLYFTLDISDSGDDVWTSNFTDIAHAPILAYVEYSIDDTGGNNNGKIDPGESADLIISIANNGTSGAYNVLGDLSSPSPYIEIPESQVSYGDIAADTNAQRVYSIIADATTPEGHLAAFELAITADMDISANGEFEVVVGQIPVLVVDFDGNHNSFPEMDACFNNLGVARDMVNSLEDVDPNLYQSVFVCLGIYPDNYALTEAEGQKLANYLENGGNIYMEGGDTWYYDDQTAVHDMFNIEALDDGDSDLGSLNGMQGSIVEGMDYTYEGENNWIDRIAAIEPATDIFMNLEPEYISAVSYDEGSYKTIGASFEFGGFENGDYTKDELMYEILHFFGIETVWVGLEENTVLNRQTEISVYPNPFQDHLEIRIDSDKILRCSIEIFDIVGNRVMSYEAGIKNKFVKNTSALKTGIYFIRVHSENEISTHKIIKH